MKKQKRTRYFAAFMILNILFEVISPTVSMALTNGPVQPEYLGFEPANSSEMVDLFTGNFKYNIPLMDVDGYPINLAYHAGVTMDAEASWVGLGWTLNPGVLNRMVKGLPDDFNGDVSSSSTYMKPITNMGIGNQQSDWFGIGAGLPGFVNLGYGQGCSDAQTALFSNYKGYGFVKDHDVHQSLSMGISRYSSSHSSGVANSVSSQDGQTHSENFSNGTGVQWTTYYNGQTNKGEGTSINTRSGAITKSFSNTNSGSVLTIGGGQTNSGTVLSGPINYYPKSGHTVHGGGWSKSNKSGFWGSASIAGPYMGVSLCGGVMDGHKNFYNSDEVVNNERNSKSYGYLYLENSTGDELALQDYNRFRDGAVMMETPNASMSSATYDLFFASAQGMGSTFRSFRSDVGVFGDPKDTTSGYNIHHGNELGGPFILHELYEKSEAKTFGTSGKWKTLMDGFLKFKDTKNANLVISNSAVSILSPRAFSEKAYFKELGELSKRDASYEGSLAGENMVVPQLIPVGDEYSVVSPIYGWGRTKRDIRGKYIKKYTGTQAKLYGFEKLINLYQRNNFNLNLNTNMLNANGSVIDRDKKSSTVASISNYTPVANHISEMSITNKDGDRYIYGIPTYNLKKKTVLFNASDRTETGSDTYTQNYNQSSLTLKFPKPAYNNYTNKLPTCDDYQFVQYNPTTDITQSNVRGTDNLVQKEVTPPYATSFLLTNILSADYVDVTGNGPSYDDFGNFTKFNYNKETDFQWRDPYCFDYVPMGGIVAQQTIATNIQSQEYQAHFEPGKLSDFNDNKAFYQYGIRENYYLHSIETKNYVAVFKTSDRLDNHGVQNEGGTPSTSVDSYKLDEITLYSKNDIAINGISNATPLKTVHFEYSYTLCPGTFNSAYDAMNNPVRSKLTLKKLYFTFGKSKKSSLTPYEFFYADNNHDNTMETNYCYHPLFMDRWGSYKSNAGNLDNLNNNFFPYAEQNKILADQYATAWNLTKIKTPSGSSIKITYEADDYGYVQNEQAAQMLQVYDCVQSVNYSSDINSIATFSPNIKDFNYLIIDLKSLSKGIPASMNISDAEAFSQKNLFRLDKSLYFKVFMELANTNIKGLKANYYEFIPGYATVESVKLLDPSQSGNTYVGLTSGSSTPVNCYRFAVLKLKKEIAFGSQSINPITLAGWDFVRNQAPHVAYPGSEVWVAGDPNSPAENGESDFQLGLGIAQVDFENAMNGVPNKRFWDNNYCVSINFEKSFVRAYSPYKTKLGGGHRVKQITTCDEWATLTGPINSSGILENNTTYSQAFEYITEEDNNIISSGVAFYEPLVGGDEISLHQPIKFSVEKQYAPNDHFYQDTPLGEMLYPSAEVGYSKVTVRNLPDPTNSTTCPVGKIVYEYYTAKDFPISDESSVLDKRISQNIPSIDEFILIPSSKNILHTAQGNLLKFNDMHGKLKAVNNFSADEKNDPVSKIEYFYKCKSGKRGSWELITTADCIDERNTIYFNQSMARDIDVSADTRENVIITETTGNTDLFEEGLAFGMNGVGPQLPPTIEYKLYSNTMKFGIRTASMTKIVQQYGILDKVVIYNDKTKTTSENLLWDANTGNVVLTRISNNYDDIPPPTSPNTPTFNWTYHFNYPAYWAYPQMSNEYQRDGISLYCPSAAVAGVTAHTTWDPTTGVLTSSCVNGFYNSRPVIFEVGDEVSVTEAITGNKVGERLWVVKDPKTGTSPHIYPNSNYMLVDQNGLSFNTTNYGSEINTNTSYIITLIRPINRNKVNASMGNVVSLSNPIVGSSINYLQTNQIVEASAQEYFHSSAVYFNDQISSQNQSNIPPLLAVTATIPQTTINPIICGYFGDFKPTRTYKYKVKRLYGNQPDAKKDGAFAGFTPFWSYNPTTNGSSDLQHWDNGCFNTNIPSPAGWVKFNENQYYSPYGELLQCINSIGIPSSKKFGFNHTLQVLSAFNAEADEVGFDSFEEYLTTYPRLNAISSGIYNPNILNNDNLGIYRAIAPYNTQNTAVTTTNATAHTGKYSLFFANNKILKLKFNTGRSTFERSHTLYEDSYPYTACVNGTSPLFNCNGLNLKYKTYIVSFWIKAAVRSNLTSPNSTSPLLDYSGLVNLNVNTFASSASGAANVNAAPTLVAKTGIINDWQKLDYEITISAPANSSNSNTVYTELSLTSGYGGGFYLDDFRIQPFNSNMVSNVYDPYSLRLWAQLDDQNYATFFEYDKEGNQIRKKRETEKTIYTLSERQSGMNKR